MGYLNAVTVKDHISAQAVEGQCTTISWDAAEKRQGYRGIRTHGRGITLFIHRERTLHCQGRLTTRMGCCL